MKLERLKTVHLLLTQLRHRVVHFITHLLLTQLRHRVGHFITHLLLTTSRYRLYTVYIRFSSNVTVPLSVTLNVSLFEYFSPLLLKIFPWHFITVQCTPLFDVKGILSIFHIIFKTLTTKVVYVFLKTNSAKLYESATNISMRTVDCRLYSRLFLYLVDYRLYLYSTV